MDYTAENFSEIDETYDVIFEAVFLFGRNSIPTI